MFPVLQIWDARPYMSYAVICDMVYQIEAS